MTEPPLQSARPYASWVSLGSGLVALGFAMYVLFSGDVLAVLKAQPKEDPLLMTALVEGIVGTLAGIIALARKEPRRLALLGLVISVVAILAKFFIAIVAVALVLGIIAVVMVALS